MEQENTTDDLLSSTTKEALVMFIESQCSIEEIYAIFDMTDKELERTFNIEDFQQFYDRYNKVGQAKIKASQYNKAISGNAELLKFLGRNMQTFEPSNMTVLELPDNGRIRK